MKKFLLLLLIPTSLTAQDPSDKDLFAESSEWNDVDVLESYVDFQKDVLSSSNLSIGFVGGQVSTTLNLGYSKSSLNGKWSHSFLSSLNPTWDYYGFGYGISKVSNNKISTLQAFFASDFDFQKDISISFIELFPTEKLGTFGYNVNVSKTIWGEYEYEDEFLPAASNTIGRGMLMYTYTFETQRIDISPQVFALVDIFNTYKDGFGDLNGFYFNDANLDLYYGTSLDWKLTNRFVLNTNLRLNKTFDPLTELVGFKKSNPVIFMVGTQFQF